MHWILTVSDTFELNDMITRSRGTLCAPFRVSSNDQYLHRVERLSDAHTFELTISQSTSGLVLQADAHLNSRETEEISQKAWRMLRIGEIPQPFLDMASKTPELASNIQHGILQLRGTTLFEDLIKAAVLISTDNNGYIQAVTWLVDHFGDPLPHNPTLHAFPTVSQLREEADVQRNILGPKLAHHITHIIHAFEEQSVHLTGLFTARSNLNDFEHSLRYILDAPNDDISTAMGYLGRYDYIPVDPHAQQQVGSYLGDATPATPATVRALFEPWQPWGGLAYTFWDWSRHTSQPITHNV